MERICQEQKGLWPAPAELTFKCSCPDWASMCKHVAAVFYGIGARLDAQPELLFLLRGVDENDLITRVSTTAPLAKQSPAKHKVLAGNKLSELFGIEIATDEATADVCAARKRPPVAAASGSSAVKSKRRGRTQVGP